MRHRFIWDPILSESPQKSRSSLAGWGRRYGRPSWGSWRWGRSMKRALRGTLVRRRRERGCTSSCTPNWGRIDAIWRASASSPAGVRLALVISCWLPRSAWIFGTTYIQTKRNPSIGRGFGIRTPSRIRFLRCHIRTIRLLLFGKYCAHSTIKHIGTATAEHQLEKNRPRYVPELVGKSRTGKLHVEASNFNCGCFCHPTFDIDCKNWFHPRRNTTTKTIPPTDRIRINDSKPFSRHASPLYGRFGFRIPANLSHARWDWSWHWNENTKVN